MKLYIATCLERAHEAAALAERLGILGHTVTSRWHDLPGASLTRESDAALDADERLDVARENLADVYRSHAVVFLADPRCRGSLLECGYAIGRGIRVLAIGEPSSVTAMLGGATWLPTLADLVLVLRAEAAR